LISILNNGAIDNISNAEFVEKLLSAQALFLAPFLSNILYGKLPVLSAPSGLQQEVEPSKDAAASPVDVIKRVVDASQNENDTTPAALSAFYLNLGKRLRDDSTLPVSTPATGSSPTSASAFLSLPRPATPNPGAANVQTPAGQTTPNDAASTSLKRNLQAANLYTQRGGTPAVSPPASAWGIIPPDNERNEVIPQRPLTGHDPWPGEYVGRDLADGL
jgi:hypothetical protein